MMVHADHSEMRPLSAEEKRLRLLAVLGVAGVVYGLYMAYLNRTNVSNSHVLLVLLEKLEAPQDVIKFLLMDIGPWKLFFTLYCLTCCGVFVYNFAHTHKGQSFLFRVGCLSLLQKVFILSAGALLVFVTTYQALWWIGYLPFNRLRLFNMYIGASYIAGVTTFIYLFRGVVHVAPLETVHERFFGEKIALLRQGLRLTVTIPVPLVMYLLIMRYDLVVYLGWDVYRMPDGRENMQGTTHFFRSAND